MSEPRATPRTATANAPEPTVRTMRYVVSCLPEKHFHFALTVEYRGEGKWAVMDGPFGLFADGSRDWESLRGDRFDLDAALALAKRQAPLMTRQRPHRGRRDRPRWGMSSLREELAAALNEALTRKPARQADILGVVMYHVQPELQAERAATLKAVEQGRKAVAERRHLRELIEDLLNAQETMLQAWAESSPNRQREIWQQLHERADDVRGILREMEEK